MSEPLSPGNINDTFFNGLYKDIWRKLIPHGLSEAEVDFIEEIGDLQAGSHVLDLMCGYGRHTLELARRNFQVTAIDNSPEYVEEVSTKSSQGHLPVSTSCSGAVQMQLDTTFDMAICMGNSFAFFREEEAVIILRNLSDHLRSGGKLLINTWMIAEIAIRHFKEKDWFYLDELTYLTDNAFLFHPTRIETDHILVHKNGSMQTIKGIDYIFTIAELNSLFKKTGFRLVDIYSTPRKKKFRLGDTKAYIVAEKI
jgi:2-polyprenyl-3-methyl-5-hydroxy-6-metoxy-1,4-benzoquinol methylase